MAPSLPTLSQLQILRAALLTGPLLFAGVVAFVPIDMPPAAEPLALLSPIATGVAVVAFVLQPVIARVLRRRLAASSDEQRGAAIQARLILPLAVLEGAILLQVVVWMVSQEPMPHAAIAGALWLAAVATGIPADVRAALAPPAANQRR